MRDDPVVVALVHGARDGERLAWNELVERYAPLVWSICRRHGLSAADADDVGQNVWLRLFEHLPALRVPAALPGWLAVTTQRECVRMLRVRQQRDRAEAAAQREMVDAVAGSPVEEWLLVDERNRALYEALTQLPTACQKLLALLVQEPRPSYQEISARLDMKIGSLGPRRARCLDKLRQCLELSTLTESAVTDARAG
jgi:RNA polymerase sigma factor (sigma-70 family)